MPQPLNSNRVQHNLEQHLSKLGTDPKAHTWGYLYSLPTQNSKAFAGNTDRYSLECIQDYSSFHMHGEQTECFTCRPPVQFTFPGPQHQGTRQQVHSIYFAA